MPFSRKPYFSRNGIYMYKMLKKGCFKVLETRSRFVLLLSDPEWPTLPLGALLEIAFKGHLIDGPNHPVMQRLNGII